MTEWTHKLELADIWRNDEMPLMAKRDHIVDRIKRLPLYDPEGEEREDELWHIVDELSDVQDVDEFDMVWDAFYDWADSERVWVELWTVK